MGCLPGDPARSIILFLKLSKATPWQMQQPQRPTRTLDPVFQIQRVYLKEASLEQPNSPAILLAQEQPEVDIQLGVDATPVADGMFEVTVTATVQTKIGDKTVFLVEAKQAGIFEIRNLPQEQMGPIMGISLPCDCVPVLARQRGRPGLPRWLSACAFGGNQLPSHVRAAASGASCNAAAISISSKIGINMTSSRRIYCLSSY